jgi:hypothetical protein
VSEAGDFIDAALQHEVSPYAYSAVEADGLLRYGTSVGAIRGTVRNALQRYPGMGHDEVVTLASELWSGAVLERRVAAIVLLQGVVGALVVNDLTRLEGFLRTARAAVLVEQLLSDVLEPMISGLDALAHARAMVVVRRWAGDANETLRMVAARGRFDLRVT